MAAHDLDVLVPGRQSNVRYVSGAPQLWVAGTRPFAPSCVLLRDRGVHLLSTWDEGGSRDMRSEHLYGMAWNPVNTIENLKKIPVRPPPARVGSDALSPDWLSCQWRYPQRRTRRRRKARWGRPTRIKTPEEIDALRESIPVAEVGLAAAVARLEYGASLQLTTVLLEAIAAGGGYLWGPAPAHSGRGVGDRQGSPRGGGCRGDKQVHGDLVAFASGVLDRGYIGEVGRTWPVGRHPQRAPALCSADLTSCMPR